MSRILLKHHIVPYPVLLIAALLILSMLAGCTTSSDLPADAQKAVEDSASEYYTSGFGNTTFDQIKEIKVSRAWEPENARQGAEAAAGVSAFWCVELVVSGERAGSSETINDLWLVAKKDAQSEWLPAALETISAQQTIDRCSSRP